MIRFFSKKKANGVLQAKNRLISVISCDRMNTVENSTMEKIRKDVTSVLTGYAGGNSDRVKVTVKKVSPSYCALEATVSIDTA